MKFYKVILTEAEIKKVRQNTQSDEFLTVGAINEHNYKKYIGKKVNVKYDVELDLLNLTKLPITFGTVGGEFNCSGNKLTSLVGCPSEVGKDFDCSDNRLTSLKNCPSEVGGNFYCSGNRISSLKGCPSKIVKGFDCSNNKLTSLEDGPSEVGWYYECNNNRLTSL